MKMVKTRLPNRTSDVNLPKLMHIAIEGPDLSIIDFLEILEVLKKLLIEFNFSQCTVNHNI